MIESWKQSGLVLVAMVLSVMIGGGLQTWSLRHKPAPVTAVSVYAPFEVASRTVLPFCGMERATTQRGPWNQSARECFWKAYLAQRPAEFISTRLTIEGDPFTAIFRVLAGGRVEVFVDTTQDRFGDRGWERLDCPTLAHAETLAPVPDFGPDGSCVATSLH